MIDTSSRLYSIWGGMKQRCSNPKLKYYCNYGGRGIKVCEEWQDAEIFITWALANGYEDTLTIDRKNVNLDYTPSNCTWSTVQKQNYNKRTSRKATIDGVTRCIGEWAEISGISKYTLYYRANNGIPDADLLKPIVGRGGVPKNKRNWG